MKNLIRILLCSVFLVWSVNSKAEMSFGVGVLAGQLSTTGSEKEGTATDTSTRSTSFDEVFVGADIFAEYISDGGYTLGISYVPLDIEIGSGERTDTTAGADVASEADTGTRSASADVSDLTTIYTNVPLGANGWYGLLGYHFTTIETAETLNASSYPNEDITGYQIGFGQKSGNVKMELSYSDFEDISISASGGNTNSVTADADVVNFRISYGF